VDWGDLEQIAIAFYERHKLDAATPVSTAKLATLELGEDAIVRAELVAGPAARFVLGGRERIGIKRGLPKPYALFFVGHELAHVVLERERFDAGEHLEAACDYLAAALIAPAPSVRALYRTFGYDLEAIAKKTRSTQTGAILRIGEVEHVPLAAISPRLVRVRGELVWPDERTIRAWARGERPGLQKVPITDGGRGRVALVGGED